MDDGTPTPKNPIVEGTVTIVATTDKDPNVYGIEIYNSNGFGITAWFKYNKPLNVGDELDLDAMGQKLELVGKTLRPI